MHYNSVADSFHTKKLCSRLSSRLVRFYTDNGRFAFLSPPPSLRGVGATYDDHFRLIRKRTVDFLLVLIELFLAKCYGSSATSEERFKIDFAPTGPGTDPKFQVEGVAPTNHSSSKKTRLNDLSYSIKIWTDISSVLPQCTCLTNRQTDRILIARPLVHYMQRGKNH